MICRPAVNFPWHKRTLFSYAVTYIKSFNIQNLVRGPDKKQRSENACLQEQMFVYRMFVDQDHILGLHYGSRRAVMLGVNTQYIRRRAVHRCFINFGAQPTFP